MNRNGPNRVAEVRPEFEELRKVVDLREGLLRFQRLMAERGVTVKLPSMTPELNWTPPPIVFPFDGDEMSAFVVRLRREGRL